MTFLRYLSDKRPFLLFYAGTLLFVSLVMYFGPEGGRVWSDILYVDAVCLTFAAVYLAAGYRSRLDYYRFLAEPQGQDPDEWTAALPAANGHEQRLALDRFRALHRAHGLRQHSLQDEMKDHRDFILSWIHEVKLPISAGRLLVENAAGKDAEEVMDKLEDELDKIDHYVEQALYYSRIDSFSRDYLIADTSVGGIVKDSVKKYAKLFIAKRIGPRILGEDLVVHSDRKWLAYIVDQIVANSLKYAGEDGTVSFAFEEDATEKRLVVTDNGIGIPPEDLGRVFDKGFTGSAGRTNAKSTGLGLYLAKQMAVKLGHDLSVRSEPGAWTRMTVHFPKFRNYTRFNDPRES